MGAREQVKVVDQYGQKLLNSGYSHDQVRQILVNGIKGFEGRKNRCAREGGYTLQNSKREYGSTF